MKKIVSSLLITVGSLGILAGIAGAVYAFSRNGSKIKDWITGDETSQTTSQKTSSSSESSSEAPTSSSSEQSSSSSELPVEVPYNDPSKPLGVTVNIEPFEYYHEDGVSPVTVPIDVYTTGWEDGGETTLTYEIVGISGQSVVGVSLAKQGSNDALTGYTGDLPGGGHYTLTMNQAGYDEFYIYQFKVTAALGNDEHVAQAKFCSNGAVSNSPYQGSYESSGINLVQRDGTQTRSSIQADNDTANTATYYVVSSHAESTKRIKVHVDPWEEGDTVLLETDEFGSNASELIVPAGTEIRFKYPKKNQGEADRYKVSLNFVGEADVWTKTVVNYGTTVTDAYLIHPEDNAIEYDPQVDGADFRIKPIAKVRDDDGSILKSAKIEFDNNIKDVMSASLQQYDRSNSINTSSYLRYASIDYVVSDQWINFHLGPIDPGVSGTVTVRALGMTWSFTYYREAPKALLWFNPESVILTNGNATTKTFHVYFPEGQRDAGLCQMSLRNPTTNGSTISDIVLQGTSSNGEMVNVTHGGTVSIAYPSFIEGGYKKYTLNFYYNGVLVNTVDCQAGRTTANANWETILNVYDQTITSNNGYFDHDIGIYFLKSTAGKTAWLEIYIDNAEVQFQLTSDDFSAYNSVGNTWQNQVTPVPGSIGNVHVRALGTLEEGSYVMHFKHYYSDHPNLDGAFCTFNKTITLVVS